MVAIILFGVLLAVCAVVVVRLARDARIDPDVDQDVFERRAQAWRATLRRFVAAWRSWRQRASSEAPQPRRPEAATVRLRRPEAATVRFAPTPIRRDRDQPTVPALTR